MERDVREQVDRLLAAIDRLELDPAAPEGLLESPFVYKNGHLQGQIRALRTRAEIVREALAGTVAA